MTTKETKLKLGRKTIVEFAAAAGMIAGPTLALMGVYSLSPAASLILAGAALFYLSAQIIKAVN